MKEIERFGLAWISLTYQCNNKCVWCYASSNDTPTIENKQLNPQVEEGVVHLISQLGIPRVTLIGGEPSLYPYLERIIRRFKENKIQVGIVTNGRRFKDMSFLKKLKTAGLQNVTFSIEGSNSEYHDRTTQIEGSLKEALVGLENAQMEGLRVSTNTLISKLSICDLENTFLMLFERGVRDMGYNICGVCTSNDRNNQYLVSPIKAISAFEKVFLFSKSKGAKARLVTPMPHCNFDENLLNQLRDEHAIASGPCQLIHGKNFVLDYNGDIVPCTHLTGHPLFNIFSRQGVMSKEEFIGAYNSAGPFEFRQKMNRYPTQKCDGCLHECSGGCPLFWIKFDPDREIKGRTLASLCQK
jgi:radical SAM protein with 4Fe4S-binding SPASM domain